MAKDNEKSKVETDLESVTAVADRLKLKGDERRDYIRHHMRGYGYKAQESWVEPEGDEDKDRPPWGRRNRNNDDDNDF